jgi:predicted SprT family Zn-dependent metalloprotease
MDMGQAEAMMMSLMREHGLTLSGWRFKWDRAVKRNGSCNYGTRTLTLSRALTPLRTEAEVRNTVLHEIAHAMAGHRAGHGVEWRKVHRALGGDGRTRSASSGGRPEMRWNLTCPVCDYKSPRARRTSKTYACSRCCKAHAHGRFDARFTLVWRSNPAFTG